ncbi:ABC transporter permease [Lactococcus laudensis]|uniref:ABC transporter permease n=1 Tax=Pseudolactococcus laudensis TaxID=1494461 RepID=UPI002FCC00B5
MPRIGEVMATNQDVSLASNQESKKQPMPNRERKNQVMFHLMMIPGLLFLIIFTYVPMAGVAMAFQNYIPAKGLLGSHWIGLAHFQRLFSLPDVGLLFRNTIVIALGKIIIGTVLSAVVMNMFNLDGSITQMLEAIGLKNLNFLGSNKLFQPLLVGTDVWKEFGYSSVVYLAAITSIDPGLYEAASIDGASWFRKVWHVTLPGMMTIILLLAIMNLPNILNAGFDQVYNLYSPMVYESGDILDTYVYRVGLIGRQYSFGTAVGLFKAVIGAVLMIGANEIAGRYTDRKMF